MRVPRLGQSGGLTASVYRPSVMYVVSIMVRDPSDAPPEPLSHGNFARPAPHAPKDHPFIGEGFLFDRLRGAWVKALSSADTLLFVVAIGYPRQDRLADCGCLEDICLNIPYR